MSRLRIEAYFPNLSRIMNSESPAEIYWDLICRWGNIGQIEDLRERAIEFGKVERGWEPCFRELMEAGESEDIGV
jgi:hypothetical protein